MCRGRLTRPGQSPVLVSLTVLHELSSDAQRREFVAKADKMATFSSENVERLKGVVTARTPYVIVTELPSNGCLLDFIRVRFNNIFSQQFATARPCRRQRNRPIHFLSECRRRRRNETRSVLGLILILGVFVFPCFVCRWFGCIVVAK